MFLDSGDGKRRPTKHVWWFRRDVVLQWAIFDGNQRRIDVVSFDVAGAPSTRTVNVADAVSRGSSSSNSGGGGGVAGCSTATAGGHKAGAETSIAGTESAAVQTVDCEIEAGVQVRQHGRVQVNGRRQTVGAVTQQHDDVRAPAADERDEDDENCFHLTYSLYRCYVTGFSSVLEAKPKHKKDSNSRNIRILVIIAMMMTMTSSHYWQWTLTGYTGRP